MAGALVLVAGNAATNRQGTILTVPKSGELND
jgi:hypothetical protein